MLTDVYLSDRIAVRQTQKRGRGVFALEALEEGILIERSPVIIMNALDRQLLDQTPLHDYIFVWGEKEDQCCMALGYVPLYNHAAPSNCEYVMDFEAGMIAVITVRNIEAGEELFINYNGDWNNMNTVWFELK